jgi:photosystem II stability/assembly factor-like uncharacterized protein
VEEVKIRKKVTVVYLLVFVFVFSVLGNVSAHSGGIFYHFQPVNDGLYGANITTLEIDANYPNTIYAGTSNEGIFISSDLGKTWKWISKGLELNQPGYVPTYLPIYVIKTVKGKVGLIYAGTSNGLFYSEDGGLTWNITGNLNRKVFSIYVDPNNSSLMLVGTDNGVYRSIDGGKSFEEANKDITNISVYYIMADSSMKDAFYIGTDKGIYKTIDNCDTWLLVNNGLGGKIVFITQNPKKPYMLYAASSFGVYITYDYGDHWASLTAWDVRPSVSFIVIDNFNDKNVLAVAKEGILSSNDSGNTWNWIFKAQNGTTINYGLVNGNDFSTVYLGTNFGFAIWSNVNFYYSNKNLGLLNITAVGFDENYKVLYAEGSLGLYKKSFNGTSWEYLSGALYGAMSHSFAVDPKVPNSMFAATKYGIMRSTDNGENWTETKLSGIEFFSITFSKANPNYVYAVTSSDLYFSRDSGTNWTKYTIPNAGVLYSVVAPSNGSVIILTQNSILKSNDLKNWSVLSDVSKYRPVTLAGDYYNPDILYLGTLDGVYISKDGGVSWDAFSDLPSGTVVYSIVSINDASNTIYLGTNSGVYMSVVTQDNNPPNLQIISPQDNARVSSPSLIISGVATDIESGIAKVTINDITVQVSSDGTFSFIMTLSPGENKIVIKAFDKAGNLTTKTLTVYYAKTTILILFVGSNKMITSDGEAITLDSPPVIVEGRTLVPIRPIIEKFGGSIAWDNIERKVTIILGNKTIEMWIDKPQARVNGIVTLIDPSNSKVTPKIINGRTMLPVRFVSEQLGAKVDWDGTLKKITITYPAP